MASGFDGLIYSIGFLVGWPVITFLMAERLRNLGKFTFADVAAFRFEQTPIRIFAASGTLVVVAFYLIAQMVGAGQLIKLLFGPEHWIAVVIVGALMMVYVLFGGMTATTWVQIIKACLLLGGASFMALSVLWHFGFSPEAMFAGAVKIKTDLALKDGKTAEVAASLGQSIMGPGNFVKDPISAISFGMALMFGTAGLPHILMRFFTVPSAKEARKSVMWATGWIGYFYLLTFIIGFGAITFVLTNPQFLDAKGALLGGNNMAAVHLSNAVGGNVFLGFISAVAFATILAVVAGLTLSGASAVSHDLYATVIKKGKADSASELRVSKMTTIALGVVAVVLAVDLQPVDDRPPTATTESWTPLRNTGQWVIGTALGLYFTPAVGALVASLWWAIALGIAWALLLGLAFGAWLRRLHAGHLAHLTPAQLLSTTYFAGAIGGASEMTLIAERQGARTDLVAAAHSLRIMMVVGIIPFAIQYWGSHGLGLGADLFVPGARGVQPLGLLGLMLLTSGAALALKKGKLPNAWVIGPLLMALLLTAFGVHLSRLPEWMVKAGQLFIGISLGTRFTPGFLHT
eukprot:gene15881-33469_t